MKIKEISLYGFKSFYDETKILLNAGITAFVGPNGSGKSNIFDALRWVFGEQSMKALRCERTEDLIYTSSDAKHDAKFTEISVIIENEDYFPQFGGEFEIKRCFYRSGESEFFLNRVKCRLQDIQALFLNSGTLTYSFLELSEIEKIIEGDTKEMFDDVSGILKYQERREQTRRRLEATEHDLLRLEDIIAEMNRGVRSLKRQVRKAKVYQDLREEYKTLSLLIMKNEYNTALLQLRDIQQQIDDHESRKHSVLQDIKVLEEDREKLKNEMAQVDTMKKEVFTHIATLNQAIDDLLHAIDEKEEEAKLMTLSHERTMTSIREKEERLENNKKRLLDFETMHNEISVQIETLNAQLDDMHKQRDEQDGVLCSLKDCVEEKEHIVKALSDKIHTGQSEISRVNYDKGNKESALGHMCELYETKCKDIDEQQRLKKELEQELELIIQKQEEINARMTDAHKRLADHEKRFEELQGEITKREEAIADCRIIIDTLNRRLQEKEGVKEIEERLHDKIQGLFRDNIEVTPGYESIVDICLGDLLNFYLITHYEAHDFKNVPEGRFGFIYTKAAVDKKNPPVFNDAIPISQLITLKSSHDILEKYIDDYFLINDFQRANELSLQFPEYGFVTPDGFLFRNGSIIVEKGEIGYFRINISLQEYKEKLETLQNELLFTFEEKKRLSSEIDEAKKSIEEGKEEIFSTNIEKSEHSIKSDEVKKTVQNMLRENDRLKKDKETLSKEIELLAAQCIQIEGQAKTIDAEIQEIENEKNNLCERVAQIQKEINEKNALLNTKTTELFVLQERRSSAEKAAEQMKKEIVSLETEVTTLKGDTGAEILQELNNDIASLKERLESKKKEKSSIESKLPERLIEEYTQRQNDIYDRLTQKQKASEEIQNGIMQLKYEQFQLSHKKDEVVRKAQEEFGVDVTTYVPEEIDDAEVKLVDVKERLAKLGEINPLSLQAYENEKKRLDEFFAQRDDIIAAKKTLLNSIEELDQRARDRFVDVFGQIKKEFNFVFSNFFEGGEADLLLTNPDNPLTSRIEIVVRMKGKRLKVINQLSGGERTLLAISLLLAFYLVKPAPFCILDEIDAPLDDVNVVRFNKFLRDLSQRTQVIIITHNRATMEYADYLYGLTMERLGQSKVISARLADLEKIPLE
ncbi:MAG: chromosome segregation protein SMC [candidate division WOR-3 bacterium]|nr:MAG: chromosome segregation protein SMC [candidate division WOR-3 bacterium]